MAQWGDLEQSRALEREITRSKYQAAVAEAKADRGAWERVRQQEKRLERLGVRADLVGIQEETARCLTDQWCALAEGYPDAAAVWIGVATDPDGVRLGADLPMG